MRRGEGLVKVDVHDVEAHIAGTASTQHGVQVGAVVVHQAASIVNQLGNLWDARLKETECVGIGHHHGGNLCALLCDDALQVLEINGAVGQ